MRFLGRNVYGDDVRISQSTITDRKATIVELTVDLGETVFIGAGSSWRVPEDPYDAYTGQLVAARRALDAVRDEMDKEMHRRGLK